MKAFELLSDESKWCKQVVARTIGGILCDWNSPEAVRWCAMGAVLKCYSMTDEMRPTMIKLWRGLKGESIAVWNDASNFQTVHNKLKELDI